MDTRPTTASTIKNNEAEYCGRVPLHQTNLIQPHGVLLIVDSTDLVVLQASENVSEFVGIPAAQLVTTSLDTHLTAQQVQTLRQRLAAPVAGKIPIVITLNGTDFLALLSVHAAFFLAELERVETTATTNSFVDIYGEVKGVMAEMEGLTTVTESCALIARQLKRLSGFDKVMIYRFDKDWNGEVIAEEREAGMESYMGLMFPASDIPRQARELYKKNPYRLIPNIDYTPVKLYPVINPKTGGFADLTDCNLRSVAAVHLEYLQNMRIKASMSTRILKDGELWGLIACHHRTPKYLPYQVCSLFEMLSSLVTARISAVETASLLQVKSDRHQQVSRIVESLYQKGNLLTGLMDQQEVLLEVLQADGIAVSLNRQIEAAGRTPDPEQIDDLIFWLQANGVQRLYHQPALSEQYEGALPYAREASGLLALPVQADKGTFILAFRSEAVEKINWGGNPNEAVQFTANDKQYHPRNSFQLWQETVYNASVPWTTAELDVAEYLRNVTMEFVLNKA